ncbi:hypothetical protein EV426DRAFT_623789 [Tirmania nivea]|nr:hypothetical protein EV426DRAFT_623789 [Tirmania nivea]
MKPMTFLSTVPIYMFFSMFGMLSVVTAAAIPKPAPVALGGTGVTQAVPVYERAPVAQTCVSNIEGENGVLGDLEVEICPPLGG